MGPHPHLTLDSIPIEVLWYIISFISVFDIIRLQKVSKFFKDVTEVDIIWRNAYRTTSLPRCPGPFPHQSTETLKNALVQSARLTCNWADPKSAPRPTSRRNIDSQEGDKQHDLLFGRWLMYIDKAQTQVKCVDLDVTNCEDIPVVVYRSTVKIRNFSCLATTTLDGQTSAFAIVLERRHQPVNSSATIKLFKLSGYLGPALSFELAESYPIDWRSNAMQATIGPRLLVISGIRPWMYSNDVLYVDLDTFSTYSVALPPMTPGNAVQNVQFIPCAAHLLVLHTLTVRGSHPPSLFEAFSIPAAHEGPKPTSLALTHRSLYHNPSYSDVVLLHDPVVAPWIGEASICLAVTTTPSVRDQETTEEVQSVVRLFLSNDSSTSPGTITCETQDLFSYPSWGRCFCFSSSSNGAGRGIRFALSAPWGDPFCELQAITLAVEGPSQVSHTVLSIDTHHIATEREMLYDGYRGRLLWLPRSSDYSQNSVELLDFV
ncbi:hypothetical protein BJ138DRAFT_827979 [Hygrophoropsis aurantiaca]|uniref:Uncharacterized protein n=1 Tax=Hygrophoropsis aurantiaca TaxID=72124 RepID=A0ACB8AT53_9AGAM|nr:hypothetical protein BJ138DRAFT_827979 [Hygrophoropsis aurantiaca]